VWVFSSKMLERDLHCKEDPDHICAEERNPQKRAMKDNPHVDGRQRLALLVDGRATGKAFEFDRVLLMPTAAGYRALVEQAALEINPRIMKYLCRIWSRSTIENLSFFVMAAAVYALSVLEPPICIDVGEVLLRTAAACNKRCAHRREGCGGCRAARERGRHILPKCIKLPGEILITWGYLKRYIATGAAACPPGALGVQEAMRVEVALPADFSPAASC